MINQLQVSEVVDCRHSLFCFKIRWKEREQTERGACSEGVGRLAADQLILCVKMPLLQGVLLAGGIRERASDGAAIFPRALRPRGAAGKIPAWFGFCLPHTLITFDDPIK